MLGLFSALNARRLRRALEAYDSRPGPQEAVKVAKLLLRLGRGDEALQTIKEAKRLFPSSGAIGVAYLAVRRAQAKAALKKTKALLKRDPQLEYFLRASDLHRTLGQFGKAFGLLQKAEKLFPEHWGVHLTFGKLYHSRYREQRRAGDATSCLEHLRHAYSLNPSNYETLLYLAIVTSHLELFQEANQALDAILDSIPNDPRALEIQAHVRQAMAETGQDSATDASYGEETDEDVIDSDERAPDPMLERLSAVESISGVFCFREDGSLDHASTKKSDTFDFTECTDAVKSMVAECRFDASNLGIGELQSCVLTGDDWQVYVRASESKHVVLFGDASSSEISLEAEVENTLQEMATA